MRETRLAKGAEEMLVWTDDRGTQLRGGDGYILAEHGTDQHDRLVEEHRLTGWQPVQDHDVRPTPVRAVGPDQRPGSAVRPDGEAG